MTPLYLPRNISRTLTWFIYKNLPVNELWPLGTTKPFNPVNIVPPVVTLNESGTRYLKCEPKQILANTIPTAAGLNILFPFPPNTSFPITIPNIEPNIMVR